MKWIPVATVAKKSQLSNNTFNFYKADNKSIYLAAGQLFSPVSSQLSEFRILHRLASPGNFRPSAMKDLPSTC